MGVTSRRGGGKAVHRAKGSSERRFRDLWNLVCDPATLVVAWSRVSRNRGSRTAGIDADTRRHVEARGVERFLWELRCELKAGEFRPLPVRERLIPKRDGRRRRLGIPRLKDRVVQMSLKLVLEPTFETGFYPSNYAYRPGRRAQDAIAELHYFTTRTYEWVVKRTSRRASTVWSAIRQLLLGLALLGAVVCCAWGS